MRKITSLTVLFLMVLLFVGTSLMAADAKPLPNNPASALAVPTQDPCRDRDGNEICIMFIAFDGRVNPNDPLATITAYCQRDGSIQVWSIINSVGEHLTTSTPAQSINALAAANSRRSPQIVVDVSGMQLIALPGNILQIADNRTGSGYKYNFAAAACFLPVNPIAVGPAPTVGKGTPKPPATKVTVPAVSASSTEAQAKIDVNIRVSPTISARRIGFVPRGGVMQLIARNEKTTWIKIRYGSLEGWVVAAYTNVQTDAFRALPVAK